jgi:hypothetical protein
MHAIMMAPRVEQRSVREGAQLSNGEYTMRAITLWACLLAAGLFAATFAGSSASADWSSNYAWCLMTEGSQECAFTSMAQCLASKHGNVDFCEPNNTYTGNTRSFGSRPWY